MECKYLYSDTIETLKKYDVYFHVLGSSPSTTAFINDVGNSTRRQFEIVELRDGKFKLGTRSTSYRNIMKELGYEITRAVDCDKGRYTFSVLINSIDELNGLVVKLLNEGFKPIPPIQKI